MLKKCPWYNVYEKYLNFGGSFVCGRNPHKNPKLFLKNRELQQNIYSQQFSKKI